DAGEAQQGGAPLRRGAAGSPDALGSSRLVEVRPAVGILDEVRADALDGDVRDLHLPREQGTRRDADIDGLHDGRVTPRAARWILYADIRRVDVHHRHQIEPQGVDLDRVPGRGLDLPHHQRPEA